MRLLLAAVLLAQDVSGQDLDRILQKADTLLEEAKKSYEDARDKSSVGGFVDAGFKLEEARIKYIVLQEIGSPEKQKLAADRMRSINQLSKLIHDGRVAISGAAIGKPAEPPPAKPADPAAPAPPPPASAPPPVDVTRRAAAPDPSKLRDAEKTLKDLFKEQYAKKAAADQRTLARTLLEHASRSLQDPVGYWVFCREAQDAAVRGGDAALAVQAIDAAAQLFDVDALAMKAAALGGVARTAVSPEDFASLTRVQLDLVDELMRGDQFDAADKLAVAALQHSRRSKDVPLFTRAGAKAKDAAEGKIRYLALKRAFETLAKNPEDPGANADVGQFLCFTKGSWDLGLRFLAKGSDAGLQALAAQEIALPTDPAIRLAIADGWWDISEREKNPLRKTPIQAHARGYYESALPDANSLQRMKIEKRLNEIEDAQGTGVNLLRLIDPKLDGVLGDWAVEGGRLLSPNAPPSWCRLQVPYAAPAEYDLAVTVRTSETFFCLRMGLPIGNDRQCMVVIGGEDGRAAALEMIDNRSWNDNNPSYVQAPTGRSALILYSVRRSGLSVTLDGRKIIDWKDLGKLSLYSSWQVANRNAIFIAPSSGRFAVEQLQLTPVGPPGKRLR